jgi:hypothetical protein
MSRPAVILSLPRKSNGGSRDQALLLNDSAEHFGQRSLPLNFMGLNRLNLCPFTHLYFFLNHSSFMIIPLVH